MLYQLVCSDCAVGTTPVGVNVSIRKIKTFIASVRERLHEL